MLTYDEAVRYPEAFHSLFGCSVAAFDALYAEFAAAHEQRLDNCPLTRRGSAPRKRRRGGGRRHKSPLRDRLLLALFWRRVHPTLELLGYCFSMDKTSAEDHLKDMLATLETLTSGVPDASAPCGSKRHTLQEVSAAFPDGALLLEPGPGATGAPHARGGGPIAPQAHCAPVRAPFSTGSHP